MSFNSVSVETLGNKCSFCPKYFPSFTRQRNHESLEHYSQLQELMESMGVKANGTMRTSVSLNPLINDKDKREGVSAVAKRKSMPDSSTGSGSGSIACPLCLKPFKTHQTLRIHFGKKHPDSKSYSLRQRSGESSPEAAGAVTTTTNKRLRLPIVSTARAKSNSKVPKRLSETKDTITRAKSFPGVAKLKPWTHFTYLDSQNKRDNLSGVPEPVGDSITCQICQDVFYDGKYLAWHIKHEHPDHVKNAISGSARKTGRSATPHSSDQPNVSLSRGEFEPETKGKPSIKQSANAALVILSNQEQRRGPAQKTFSCGRCPKKFSSRPKLASHLNLHRKKIVRLTTTSSVQKEKLVKTICNDTKHEHSAKMTTPSDTAPARSTRSRHAQRKEGEKGVYCCPFCDFKLTSHNDTELGKHILNDHDDVPGPISCSHCSHQCNGPMLLLYHLRTHDEEKPFFCDFCDQKFRQYHEKLTHEVNHTSDDDGYNCRKCGNCYLTLASLAKHVVESHS